jgi:hypothetical protein
MASKRGQPYLKRKAYLRQDKAKAKAKAKAIIK